MEVCIDRWSIKSRDQLTFACELHEFYDFIQTYSVAQDTPNSIFYIAVGLEGPPVPGGSKLFFGWHSNSSVCMFKVNFWSQTEDIFCRPVRCARQRASPPRSGGLRCGLFAHKRPWSHQIFVGAGRHVCPRKNLFLSGISRSAHICK